MIKITSKNSILNSKKGFENRQNRILQDKSGFEFSFTWLFAIIAGAFIIFTAIYATINLVKSGQYVGNTQLAKQLSILFNPLETGTASGKSAEVNLVQETRIYNKCYSDGSFGTQEFSLSQKSGFLKEWPEPGGGISVNNKYVFSDKLEQGKKVYFFSKPFEMPFKVSEIIFLATENYCFENPPEFVEDEIKSLGLKNVRLKEDGNCTGKETRVCFNSQCNISVYPSCTGDCENEYETGYTEKNGKKVMFSDSLIYASIFSDTEIYRCNVKRLMKRIQQLAYLYKDEAGLISSRGCGDAISSGLLLMIEIAQLGDDSSLGLLKESAGRLEEQNSAMGGCRIW